MTWLYSKVRKRYQAAATEEVVGVVCLSARNEEMDFLQRNYFLIFYS